MHGALGPGEELNRPITVHMASGRDKVSFGFSGMRIQEGKRARALFNVARTGHKWVAVEQIAPYEWREIVQAQ